MHVLLFVLTLMLISCSSEKKEPSLTVIPVREYQIDIYVEGDAEYAEIQLHRGLPSDVYKLPFHKTLRITSGAFFFLAACKIDYMPGTEVHASVYINGKFERGTITASSNIYNGIYMPYYLLDELSEEFFLATWFTGVDQRFPSFLHETDLAVFMGQMTAERRRILTGFLRSQQRKQDSITE